MPTHGKRYVKRRSMSRRIPLAYWARNTKRRMQTGGFLGMLAAGASMAAPYVLPMLGTAISGAITGASAYGATKLIKQLGGRRYGRYSMSHRRPLSIGYRR